MTTTGAAQNVALQAAQQHLVAAAAQEEVGAGTQVLFQLPARAVRRGDLRALAQADVPQAEQHQQGEGGQGFGEVAAEQAGQVVPVGVVEQRRVGVLGQVPEQPGVVVAGDVVVLPDPAVGEHGDQAVAVVHLQHVGGLVAVGPGVGAVFAVVQVEAGVEVDVGRRVLVFEVELGQLGVGLPVIFAVCFRLLVRVLLVGGGFGLLGRFIGVGVVAAVGLAVSVFAVRCLLLVRCTLGRILVDVVELLGVELLDAEAVEQQVIAGAGFLVVEGFGHEQQVAALAGPFQYAVGLGRRHVLAAGDQQQGVAGSGQGVQHAEVVGPADLDALALEVVPGGQVVVLAGLGAAPSSRVSS